MSRILSSFAAVLMFATIACAEPELLPAPRVVPSAEVLPAPAAIVDMGPYGPVLPGYWRRSQYDKWQDVSVDYQGFFRPRVILAPQPYHWYSGMPYHQLPVQPLQLTPRSR